MLNRIKEIAKTKGVTLGEIADKMQITRQGFGLRMKASSPKLSTIVEIAEILGCDPHELIECGAGYAHFYDPETGEWLGIRKK